MIAKTKEMEVLVQLGCKEIIQHDFNGKEVHIYNSIKECAEDVGLSTITLMKRIKNEATIKGYVYTIKEPENHHLS